jgi:hypothetical protein
LRRQSRFAKDHAMVSRPFTQGQRVVLGVTLALGLPGAVRGQAERGPQAEAPVVAQPPGGLDFPGSVLSGTGSGVDLRPEQLETLREYDRQLVPYARSIADPALRATTLNRIARSKIVSRELDDAHTALEEAGRAAMELPPGLSRDLRLMSIIRNLITLGHEQVVEAVPNNATEMGGERRLPRPDRARGDLLDAAIGEWGRAADLAASIANPNYRSEQLARLVAGQAADAMRVGRDARQGERTRPDLGGQTLELQSFSDRVLEQATRQAQMISQGVWSDEALRELATAAARSNQFPRARAIAGSIPRPMPRAESYLQIAESLARAGGQFRAQHATALPTSWAAFKDDAERLRTSDPKAPDSAAGLFGPDRLAEDLRLRLDALGQNAEALRQDAQQINEIFLYQREFNPALPSDLAAALINRAVVLGDTVAKLRVQMGEGLDRARALDGEARLEAIRRAMPAPDDAVLRQLDEQVAGIQGQVEQLATPIDDRATDSYVEAARSVASIELPDQRAVATRLLVDSLVEVGRFTDARRAATLIADQGTRYLVLGLIAEAQSRRGLAEEAREWILAEIPTAEQSPLLRKVEDGVLEAFDQLRMQAPDLRLP